MVKNIALLPDSFIMIHLGKKLFLMDMGNFDHYYPYKMSALWSQLLLDWS